MAWHKKEKPRPATLTLWDGEGQVCFDGELSELAIPEAEILMLSVRFFGDPEPCFIHRSAVVTRALEELARALPAGARTDVSVLPEALRRYLSGYPVTSLEIRP